MNLNVDMFFPIISIGFTMIKMEPLQMGGVFHTMANIIVYIRIWVKSPIVSNISSLEKVFFFQLIYKRMQFDLEFVYQMLELSMERGK